MCCHHSGCAAILGLPGLGVAVRATTCVRILYGRPVGSLPVVESGEMRALAGRGIQAPTTRDTIGHRMDTDPGELPDTIEVTQAACTSLTSHRANECERMRSRRMAWVR